MACFRIASCMLALAVLAPGENLDGVWVGKTAQGHKIEITVDKVDTGLAVTKARYKLELVGDGRYPGVSTERAEQVQAPCLIPETEIRDEDMLNHYEANGPKDWSVTTYKSRFTKPPIPIEDGRFSFQAGDVYRLKGVFKDGRLSGTLGETMDCVPRISNGRTKANGETAFEARKI